MKKILVIGLISGLFSAGAFAGACATTGAAADVTAPTSSTGPTGEMCACNGGAAVKGKVNGGSGTPVLTPVFVKTGFDVQCSSNTMVSFNEVSGTAFAVASGSLKGNQSFIGTSNGGAVAVYQKCSGTNDACTPTNVTAANDRATTIATGS
jgi:hypothetical protein